MDQDWNKRLDALQGQLMALETNTPDGPVLITVLLRIIDLLSQLEPATPGAQEPGED